jgi:hypothetical protein
MFINSWVLIAGDSSHGDVLLKHTPEGLAMAQYKSIFLFYWIFEGTVVL